MRLSVLLLALLVAWLTSHSASAQSYPSKPIRIVVPFGAGGSVDLLARLLGNKLSEQFNQPVVIENRPGAGGNIGADAVAKAAPDGTTILQNTIGQAITPAIVKTLPFDPLKDFVPITQLASTTLVMVASPHLPATSITELVVLAKAKPGALNYGMSGAGNPLHLTVEMFKIAAGLDIVGVPYKADAPIMAALIADEVQVAVVPLSIAGPLIETGQVRALAVTPARRSPVLPDVPTIGETIAGFEQSSWQGLFAPSHTPGEIVGLIQREVAKALAAPDVRERMRGWGAEPVGSTPAEFDAFYRAEIGKFAKVVKDARIPLQE